MIFLLMNEFPLIQCIGYNKTHFMFFRGLDDSKYESYILEYTIRYTQDAIEYV